MFDRDVPNEILQMIADWLPLESAKKFSMCSRQLFFALGPRYFLQRKDFHEQLHELILAQAIRAIHDYLQHDKSHPGYKVCYLDRSMEFLQGISMSLGNPFLMYSMHHHSHHTQSGVRKQVDYDKGFHRAHCLKHILSYKEIAVELRFFALHAFLSEGNGVRLKKRILDAFAEHLFLLRYLKRFVQQHFGDNLQQMCETLMNKVHRNSYDDYAANNSYQFTIKHSWKNLLEDLRSDAATTLTK